MPAGLQADGLELALDVLDGLVVARRAGVAAFELVVGQHLDVRPPGLAFSGEIGGLRDRAGDRCGENTYVNRESLHAQPISPKLAERAKADRRPVVPPQPA